MTYTETKGKDPFDWWAFLNKPYSEHSEKELCEAAVLSSDWVTCGVGTQCKDLPRRPNNSPVDFTLLQLGLRFMDQIETMALCYSSDILTFREAVSSAKGILDYIETRSTILLQQLGALNKNL